MERDEPPQQQRLLLHQRLLLQWPLLPSLPTTSTRNSCLVSVRASDATSSAEKGKLLRRDRYHEQIATKTYVEQPRPRRRKRWMHSMKSSGSAWINIAIERQPPPLEHVNHDSSVLRSMAIAERLTQGQPLPDHNSEREDVTRGGSPHAVSLLTEKIDKKHI